MGETYAVVDGEPIDDLDAFEAWLQTDQGKECVEEMGDRLRHLIAIASQPTNIQGMDGSRNVIYAVGAALYELRSTGLYLQAASTWTEFCRNILGYSTQWAKALINAAEVIHGIGMFMPGYVPVTEAQCRPLVGFRPAEQAAAWCQALFNAGLVELDYFDDMVLSDKGKAHQALYAVKSSHVRQALHSEILDHERVRRAIIAEQEVDKLRRALKIESDVAVMPLVTADIFLKGRRLMEAERVLA